MKRTFTGAEIAYLEAIKKAEVIKGPLKYNFTEITFHLARLEDQFYRKLLEQDYITNFSKPGDVDGAIVEDSITKDVSISFDFSSPLFLEDADLPFTYEIVFIEEPPNFFECFIKKTEEKVPEEYSQYLLHYVIHIKEADLKFC